MKDISIPLSPSKAPPAAGAEQAAAEYERELQWLAGVLDTRFKLYFGIESACAQIEDHEPPGLEGSDTAYARLVRECRLDFSGRLALALCVAPHLRPQLLDVFFTRNKTFDRSFSEFGGSAPQAQGGFLPTGATLLFLLGGGDLAARARALALLQPDHPLLRRRILELGPPPEGAPKFNGLLRLSPEQEAHLIWQQPYRPEFSSDFPARLLHTAYEWEDLVLPAFTRVQVEEILDWVRHGLTLMDDWGMRRKLRPGFRALFYGPPGTGKTLTAALLGKVARKEVYRVDLSLVVSKYIGETEKNLAKIFDQAEHRDWILFFDEADALFGKRSQVQDAHDRYANQEVSYLLQRIETFDGIAILASNLRSNLDEAFSRRFEAMIHFPMPRPPERLALWRQGFSTRAQAALSDEVDFPKIARDFDLSGGAIMNVIRQVSMKSIAQDRPIRQLDLLEGIKRELGKEGKTV